MSDSIVNQSQLGARCLSRNAWRILTCENSRKMCKPVESEGKHQRMVNAGKHIAAGTWNPLVSQRGKNVAAIKGGKICNHTRKAREKINGDKRDMRRAHELIPFCCNWRTFRAHLLARLTYLMEIYRWTAVWLTVHTGMVVIAPPMESVQKVSRTVGFGLKLWRNARGK